MITDVVSSLTWFISVSWIVSFLLFRFTGGRVSKVIAFIRYEFRPFFLPAYGINEAIALSQSHKPVDIVWAAFGTMGAVRLYRSSKDDDDDRWRRRQQKLADRVQQMGSRLVAVPEVA